MNTTVGNNLPSLSNEGGLSAYLDQIKKFPMLAAEEEYMLAKNWKTTGNIKSAEKLVTSHLRLVAKIAMGYKGYGLPVNEMISEGNVGLMQAVKKFPMLDAEEEYILAKNWRNNGNVKAAEKLVTSHLRLVAKIAMGYKGYGLPVNEMISEGNIGLMQAVKKFEPEKGFRLATYAMWWIKASIQEYILRSWSLVKIGTTTAQKKLFFNLKKIKNQIAPQ